MRISRARLGRFLQLERHLSDLREAIKEKDSGGVVSAIHSYLSEATETEINISDMTWFDFYGLFLAIRGLNTLPRDLPMLKGAGFKRKDPFPWDHPARPFILWIHLIATAYGWSKTEIESLWPEDAAIYVQEILTDEQIRKEWEHSLSTVAHPLDKQGKDQYRPLRRPSWMSPRPRKTRIPRNMLPKGHIINISGVELDDLDD
jgi:hypothetical protein